MADLTVINNEAEQQYEILVDGALAVAQYRRTGNQIVFYHTEVPVSLRNRGVGSTLVHAALEDVRARGFAIRSECWFVSAYIARHPEYLRLLSARDKGRPRVGS
jgi:uncharacterized protein